MAVVVAGRRFEAAECCSTKKASVEMMGHNMNIIIYQKLSYNYCYHNPINVIIVIIIILTTVDGQIIQTLAIQ